MASNAPEQKRQTSSSSIKITRPPFKIHPTAVVSDKASIIGCNRVEIGANTVIHPKARIDADNGNVLIGDNCIISENAVVGCSITHMRGEEAVAKIGNGVNIESSALVGACSIGNHCTIGPRTRVGTGAAIGEWCTLAPLCEVGEKEVVEDFTVVMAGGRSRVDTVARDRKEVRESRTESLEKEIELLKTLIPDASSRFRNNDIT